MTRFCALLAGGGYAEFVAVPAVQVLPVPVGIDLTEAAAIPEVACTVVSNLGTNRPPRARRDAARPRRQQRRIGTHAIQLAKHLGATVAVTAQRQEKLDVCRALRADVESTTTTRDFVGVLKGRRRPTSSSTSSAGRYLEGNVAALKTGGRLVIISMQGGAKAP